ncbi:zinc finger protein castor homolog 1 isoform X8 [Cherax quadricarinatus]|uniref:zinc finger protein castor homolog 1 isoform X8 n=1 Tax=Cherax quadricarinatus TaxID=27406 RepID=UPI00387E2847
MEVVSVAASVGEVLGGPQPPATPTYTHDHAIHAHTDHTDRLRPDEDEDEDEGDSRMDTDQDAGGEDAACDPEDVPEDASGLDLGMYKQAATSHSLEEESNPDADSSQLDDDVIGDHMECDDSESAPMFIDDDSSSRAFPETASDVPGGSPSSTPLPLPEAGRRNKRKNFKPRNIVYTYTDSEDTEGASDAETRSHLQSSDYDNTASDLPLDLSETPTLRRSLMPRRLDEAVDLTGGAGVSDGSAGGASSPSAHPHLNALLSRPTSPGPHEDCGSEASDMKEYAELTMRRLLGLYGLSDLSDNIGIPPAALYPGKLLESLKNNAMGGGEEPPTPPHTPQRENAHIPTSEGGGGRPPIPSLDPLQQQALQARMLGGGNFSTLLTLAALQEGKGSHGVPLPPTLDAHKSLSTTPTTSTSTMTPGLAGLSLGSGGGAPSSLVPGGMGVREALNKPQLDYSRYVKPYSSALECGHLPCREHNLREHFHCLECNSKVFSKKEEMIRHFKWHKKRDESLQHGFMRYSPSDDCSDRFNNCSHNRKQTHYHCLKEGCDKVYISTSDVQMHANYHRKDSAIMQEGFQRFRASEDCGQPSCSFNGQRTTHFHCMRTACNYTFKNKADMEKHKTYHIKDEQLTKDGFKKFMKQEECPYEACKFSRVVNHIHCIRPDCNYVLHSSGQIFAHKVHFNTLLLHLRKHERQDHERAYRKYKLAQTMLGMPEGHPALTPLLHEALRPLGTLGGHMINPLMGPLGGPMGGPMCPIDQRSEDSSSPLGSVPAPVTPISLPPGLQRPPGLLMGGFPPPGLAESQHPLARLLAVAPPAAHGLFHGGSATSSASTPASSSSGPASPVDLSVSMSGAEDRDWERWVRCHSRDEPCRTGCDLTGMEHWHCDECEAVFRGRESARDHGRVHEQQTLISDDHYTKVTSTDDPRPCPPDCSIQDHADHFHCNWVWNDYSVTHTKVFLSRQNRLPSLQLPVSSAHDTPQAIFTSFKLPKSSPPPHGPLGMPIGPHPMTPLGHLAHLGRETSPPRLHIPCSTSSNCSTSNCSTVGHPTTPGGPQPILLPLTGPVLSNPLQPQAEIVEGFYPWGEGVSCPDQLCPLLGRRHYHCAHPRCLYVTAHTDVLPLHAHDFHENTPIPEGFIAIDRNIDCRSPNCQSNKVNKHFHCTRCGFSFVRYQTLESHAEKHQQEDGAVHTHSLGPQSPIYLKKQRPDSPMDAPTAGADRESPSKAQQDLSPPVVKSSGIFYPLSPFPTSTPSNNRPSSTRGEAGALVTPIPPSLRQQNSTTFTLPVSGSLTITATRRSPPPLGMQSPIRDRMDQVDTDDRSEFDSDQPRPLSQQGDPYSTRILQTLNREETPLGAASLSSEWLCPERHPQYGPEYSCGRPFCKLKKKEHFHCQICNQAFSEHEKLRPHLIKHATCSPMNSGGFSVGDEEDADVCTNQVEEEDGNIQPKIEINDHPVSPRSPNECSTSSFGLTTQSISTSSPRPLSSGGISGTLSGPQTTPQFPMVYTQAASFHGLSSPFGPHLSMAGIFPGSLPRLLPPAAWQVHPALAAMAHQGLIMPGVRPNGDLTHGSPVPGGLPGVGPGMGGPGMPGSGGDHNPLLPSSLGTSPHLAMLGKRLGAEDFNAQEAKKIRSNHSIRLLKDEPVPEGYIRFRFNEDCQYPHCGYREHQTHFHCMRKDCGYSFCDKTRFVQHTARHERLDTLMGGDFNQFRSNISCGRPDCVYASMIGQQQNKASHFHCLKCDFVCTDTNKVVAHRRQHQKRDSINAAGFEKFTPSQPCGIQGCNHNQKQTHYHCLKCQYSVLGLSQMSAHRYRHLE